MKLYRLHRSVVQIRAKAHLPATGCRYPSKLGSLALPEEAKSSSPAPSPGNFAQCTGWDSEVRVSPHFTCAKAGTEVLSEPQRAWQVCLSLRSLPWVAAAKPASGGSEPRNVPGSPKAAAAHWIPGGPFHFLILLFFFLRSREPEGEERKRENCSHAAYCLQWLELS